MTGLGHAALWRRRGVRIAWAATFVNNTGDWILLVALPVYVFVETGSGTNTALLFVAQLVAGAVVAPIGGTLVDRWDLKRTLFVTNAAQAVTVLPLLTVAPGRVWPAYIVMAAQSALNQVNNPANVALVPRVVDHDELTSANAALSAADSLARLVGAPVGGLLVAWGGLTTIVLVDAVSFAVVAIVITFVISDTSPDATVADGERSMRAGVRVVRRHRPLAPLLSIHSLAQIAQGAFVVVFVVFMVDVLGDDGPGLGLIRGTMAVGALLGSIVIARLARRLRPQTLFAGGLIGMGVVSVLFWNAPHVTTSIWVYVVLFALSGLPGAALSVGFFTTLHTASPPHALGRVTGLMATGEAVGVAVGSIITGLVIDRVDLTIVLDSQAAIYLAAGVLAALIVSVPSPVDAVSA